MAYVPPTIASLLADDEKLNALLGQDPENDKLILFLLKVNAIIRKFIEAKPELTKDALQTLMGVRIYCLKKIEERKWFLGVYDHDPLHSFLKEELGLTKTNTLTPKQESIYLGKFHNVIFRNWLQLLINQQTPSELLGNIGIEVEKIRLESIEVMRKILLKNAAQEVEKMGRKPTSMHVYKEKFKDFFKTYKGNKPKKLSIWGTTKIDNPKRILHCQFAESFGQLCRTSKQPKKNEYTSRSVQMERGVAFFGMNSIDQEYFYKKFFRHDAKCSHLYLMFKDIVGADLDKFTLEDQIDCMSAMSHLLQDNQFLEEMREDAHAKFSSVKENELDEHFDLKIKKIELELNRIILNLFNKTEYDSTPTIKTVTDMVTVLLAIPIVGVTAASFFALGQQAGRLFSQSNYTLEARMEIGKGVSYATAYLGKSGESLGFFAANFWVENVLERLFGQALEILGLLVGTVSVGTIAVMMNLTFKGLRHLCKTIKSLYEEAKSKNSKFADVFSEEDLDWLQMFIDLPAEFDEMDFGQKMEEALKVKENLRPCANP